MNKIIFNLWLLGLTALLTSSSLNSMEKKSSLSIPQENYTLSGIINVESPVLSVAFSPQETMFLTGSADKKIRLWDPMKKKLIRTLETSPYKNMPNEGALFPATFNADGSQILTGSTSLLSHDANLWDAQTNKNLQRFDYQTKAVTSIAFSPDNKTVLTGSYDETARLYDTQTGEVLRSFYAYNSYGITSVAFSPDGETILTGSWDGIARLWNVHTGEQIKEFKAGLLGNGILSLAFSPDGKTIVTGSSDNKARLWDVSSGIMLRRLTGHKLAINSVAFSPDGKTVLTGSDDKTARLWTVSTSQELQQFIESTQGVTSVAFSPDGKTVLVGSVDGTVTIWSSR